MPSISVVIAATLFSGSDLLIKDSGFINDAGAVERSLGIINILKGNGLRCHHFTLNALAAATLTANINVLVVTGPPASLAGPDIKGITMQGCLTGETHTVDPLWRAVQRASKGIERAMIRVKRIEKRDPSEINFPFALCRLSVLRISSRAGNAGVSRPLRFRNPSAGSAFTAQRRSMPSTESLTNSSSEMDRVLSWLTDSRVSVSTVRSSTSSPRGSSTSTGIFPRRCPRRSPPHESPDGPIVEAVVLIVAPSGRGERVRRNGNQLLGERRKGPVVRVSRSR
jgi:hypothetical protein